MRYICFNGNVHTVYKIHLMKKITFFVIMTMISSLAIGQVGFGVKGAVTMSNFTTDFSEITEAAKTGWQLGAYVRIGDTWHLQPEVYIGAKPGELTYTTTKPTDPSQSGTITQDMTLNTIDVPVLIGYKIIDPPTLNVRFQAGPVASFVTNKTFSISGEGIDPPEASEGYQDKYSDLNWGIQFGVGVDFLFLTADIRYELGLNKIIDYQTTGGYQPIGEMKNNVFMLSVGFKILK